jgi:carbon monoxide dehydrogenase subunit G
MQLNNDFTIASSVEEAWPVLTDLSRVAPCMPGATLDSVDGNAFTGRMAIKLGPMSLAYKGEGKIFPDEAARSIVMDVAGGEQRGGGRAAAKITAVLEPLAADRTRVRVVSDLELSGKPAQFGRGILVDVAGRLLSTFAANLESELRATPLEPASSGAASTAGAQQLDLGAAALAPLLKRVAPVVLGTIVVGFIVRQLVRRLQH